MTRRSGLGRGLDALLPAQEGAGGGVFDVPVDDIAPNRRQPRRDFDDDAIAELAASISEVGLLQPLLVREGPDGYELIAGERRLRAARRAGLERVPVIVVDTDERGSLERALVENIQREDLNPVEEAAAYKQLLDEGALTQDELGRRIGRSRVAISNALRLLALPPSIQRLLVERRITAGHGRALAALDWSPFQERLARRIADEGLSVREAEDLVRKYEAMTAPRSSERRPHEVSAEMLEARRRLTDHLQTRVRVERGKRKGRIVIDFTSDEELRRLTAAMLGRLPAETVVVVPE